jgi:predicted amidophosphoribosyltransferase
MEFRCPNCHAPIYSRKNKICGVCEKPLPKELLMNDAEIAFWKKEMDEEEKRSKEFKQQIDDVGSHESFCGGMPI